MRKTILTLMLVALLGICVMADEKEDFKKGMELYKAGKYTEALKLAEEGIKKYGVNEKWLSGKFYILMKLEKYEEALEVSKEKAKIKKRKSPWDHVEIADLYLKLKNTGEALKQFEMAADKGFQSYAMLLEEDEYKPLHKEKSFDALIKKIKGKIGIGQPAKDFTVKLLSGKDFTLSKYKGKVVLVDFWATWCPPCVKEIPNLKKDYARLHGKGFEIMGVSLDSKEEKLTDYIKKEGLEWMISYSGDGWKDKTSGLYGVKSIPSTWLVGKKGNLRYFGLRGEKLAKAVETLLAE